MNVRDGKTGRKERREETMGLTTNPESLEVVGRLAADVAEKAAVAYLQKNGLAANAEALAECLRSWTKAKLSEALADAKAALDCGMGQMAETTFLATMALAGIEAAKEAGFPK